MSPISWEPKWTRREKRPGQHRCPVFCPPKWEWLCPATASGGIEPSGRLSQNKQLHSLNCVCQRDGNLIKTAPLGDTGIGVFLAFHRNGRLRESQAMEKGGMFELKMS